MLEKVSEFGYLFLAFLAYPIGAGMIIRLWRAKPWYPFAVYNLASSFILAFTMAYQKHSLQSPVKFLPYASVIFSIYLAIVILCFATLSFAAKRDRGWLVAYLTPIAGLVLARDLIPMASHSSKSGSISLIFIGISYVAFRLCHLVSEVRNKAVPMPSAAQYFAFSFFVPLLIVGPISPYSLFLKSIEAPRVAVASAEDSLIRICRGLLKFLFFSAIFAEIGYGPAFLRNGHLHSKLDLLVAVLVYPLFLYCNFSGLCDVAIGVSSLLGISVVENFNDPFSSRNFQEFWAKWHISLSTWMRDMVFTPMVKTLSKQFPNMSINHSIAMAIMTVFILIGIWHGAELHFVLFGISQGLGVVVIHYGGAILKNRLTKPQLLNYRKNQAIRVAGTIATYLYFALTLSLFANTTADLGVILHHIV